MNPLIKNLGLALVVALLLWAGYSFFKGEDEMLVTRDVALNEAVLDGQEFLSRLRELESITLDGAILEDPRFQSLIDFTVIPESEEVGRENPFAPIGSEPVRKEVAPTTRD